MKMALETPVRQSSRVPSANQDDLRWRKEIMRLLKDSLISELVYRVYCRHVADQAPAVSMHPQRLLFEVPAQWVYANQLAVRIVHLADALDDAPSAIRQLSCVTPDKGPDLSSLIAANLSDEFATILSYSRIVPLLSLDDVGTHELLNEILTDEKARAEVLKQELVN